MASNTAAHSNVRRLFYRDYEIVHDPPPIPDRSHDWQFSHVEYDGPEDKRIGSAATLEAAMAEIDELIEDDPDLRICYLCSGTGTSRHSQDGIQLLCEECSGKGVIE